MRSARLTVKLSAPLVAIAGALGAGCASSVIVQSDFPTPLIQPLPVRMGVIYSPELQDYVHAESLPQQSTWTIGLGNANLAMLSPLFETMFAEIRTVEDVPLDPSAQLDGVLLPELEKFEFDVPIGTRDEFVEVWMQYSLTLFEPDGEVVTEWPVSGYGKAELTGNREDALSRAAIVAMREVGATISTKFAEQPDVQYWLEENRNEAALSAETRLGN
ncbi:MAG: hypothetical protein JXB36_01995 [Gammaproteobacteria bacterium]|nr:hypothetical protein [Gammaproteobacteria bacterium]